jgi:hypothetical protein
MTWREISAWPYLGSIGSIPARAEKKKVNTGEVRTRQEGH